MARKAGATAIEKKDESVNTVLREIGETMLLLLCEKITIFLVHRKMKTVNEDILREALGSIDFKIPRLLFWMPRARSSIAKKKNAAK